jgi:hypothetical protein
VRIFHCDRCGAVVPFSAQRCDACGAALAYLTTRREIAVVTATPDAPTLFHVAGEDGAFWRCLNAAWGCNWLVPVGDSVWCRSCRLTRGRPDEARTDAIEAWMAAETAKRRLVHQLDEFALPIEIRSETAPDGLAFDFVHLPGHGGITGHQGGVVTLDLAEADPRHREELRRRLGEPFRTLIGHLRHEVGHHYWGRLVAQTDELAEFRQLFGDERADYGRSLDEHYTSDPSWDPDVFVTAYAASHPAEDWAETFAHYLHIVDEVDTAFAHRLAPAGTITSSVEALDVHALLAAWTPINDAVNAIAETLGAPAVYPLHPRGAVVEKLDFVHRQIAAHSERDRFYATG